MSQLFKEFAKVRETLEKLRLLLIIFSQLVLI